MEHARQWFVDLSRFMMGGSEAGCEWGEVEGEGRRQEGRGPAFSAGLIGTESPRMGRGGVPKQWWCCSISAFVLLQHTALCITVLLSTE